MDQNREKPDVGVITEEQKEGDKNIDYMARLNSFAVKQSSQALIKEFDKAEKEILSSSTSSCLAVLQAPIMAQRIKKQIEQTYVKGFSRVAGLKMIAELSTLKLPK